VGVVLDICYTSPKHHRRGAGKLLVEWGAKKADEMGVTCFVEASLVGRRLYEGCGFVVKEDVKLEGANIKEEWKDYETIEFLWMERASKPHLDSIL
jgi:hypothetical protein